MKEQNITPKTEFTVSLKLMVSIFTSVIGSAVSLAVYGTLLYSDLKAEIREAKEEAHQAHLESVTQAQHQQWIYNEIQANSQFYGNFKWENLPKKDTEMRYLKE